jgi:Flp pilus assembly pilin Flp
MRKTEGRNRPKGKGTVMRTLMNRLRRATNKPHLLSDDRGLSTVEYVIILVVIAVVAIGVWKGLGDSVIKKVEDSTHKIDELDPNASK